MSGYPPEPWELRGQLHASAFLVPLARIPLDLPAGCRPVRIGRRGVVGTAWVSYEPGGVLSYRELMATVLVRHRLRVMPTIIRIWVDSAASRDGGRALWAIPKEMAGFTFDKHEYAAASVAEATVRPLRRLPGRWPLAFRIVQPSGATAMVTPVRVRGRLALSRARLRAEPAGPLAFLAGRRELLSFSIGGFRMCFGGRPGRVRWSSPPAGRSMGA